MIRVIKPGRLDSEREHTTACDKCHCEFSFQRKDAKFHSDQRDGDAITIKCPECGYEVWISIGRETRIDR